MCGGVYGWRRVVPAAVGLLLVAATLAGCGSDASGRVVLSFYTAADGADQYAAAAAVCSGASGGRYTLQQHTLRRSTDDQRLQLARRLVANDSDLDIMLLDVIWTAEFAQAGWILPYSIGLARQIEQETLQVPYETGTYQGRLYAAPLNTNTQLLWYRKDLVPNPPKTWDEMIQMAEGLARRDLPHYIEVQGAQYEGLTVWFNTLITSAGGSIVSENGDVQVAQGDAARRALGVMARVATSRLAANPSLSVAKETDARLAMEAGLAAFEVNYPFVYASMYARVPDGGGGAFVDRLGRPTIQDTNRRVRDVFGWTAYPSVVSGKPAMVTIGGLNLGVSTTSRHPAEAFEAVQCLRNRENQLHNAVEGGLPPTLRELYDGPRLQPREYWQAIRDSLATASIRPKTPAYQDVSIVISDLLNPPAEINPDTVRQLTDGISEAVNSEGVVP